MRLFVKIASYTAVALTVWLSAALCNAAIVTVNRAVGSYLKSDEFVVRQDTVEISGNKELTRYEVLLLAGLDKKRSWFDLSERDMELFIRSNNWVKRCEVRKLLPNRVKILIEEYVPAIVLSGRETGAQDNAGNILWFADRDGTVFKKAFPGESSRDLPLLFIDDSDRVQQERREMIQRAIAIAETWREGREVCTLIGIYRDAVNGFSADCEFQGGKSSRIRLGHLASGAADAKELGKSFFDAARKLQSRSMFAAEYSFDGEKQDRKVIVGQLVQQVKRGQNAEE